MQNIVLKNRNIGVAWGFQGMLLDCQFFAKVDELSKED